MHLLQITFKNIVKKEEIAQNDNILLLPQCFHNNMVILPPFREKGCVAFAHAGLLVRL